MHLLAEQTVEIACPVAAAYRFACNLERFGEWFPGAITLLTGRALGIPSRRLNPERASALRAQFVPDGFARV
jgi:hypothetical protein